jgi:hypothetical protein
MTGIFGILESSATQWYQDVDLTQEFFLFFIVASIVYDCWNSTFSDLGDWQASKIVDDINVADNKSSEMFVLAISINRATGFPRGATRWSENMSTEG